MYNACCISLCRQDILLPFCTDERFDADTLFMIFEEDFRFTPKIDDPAWTHNGRKDTSALMLSRIFGPPPITEASSSSSSAAAAPSSQNKIPKVEPKVEPTAHPKLYSRKSRDAEDDYDVLNRAKGEEWEHPSMFLRDLVAYATLAHRAGRGDFMFMGWQPHGAGEGFGVDINKFRSGAMLTMVSKAGFLQLASEWRTNDCLKTPCHVDIALKKYWSLPANKRTCYIVPPMAGYTSHLSGTSKEFYTKERKNTWLEEFACPGTRREHDWSPGLGRQKAFYTFTAKSKAEWVCEANVDKVDFLVQWRTYDDRFVLGAAELTAGWGRWYWDYYNWRWAQMTVRQQRAGRSLRHLEKFRNFVEQWEKAGVKSYCTYGI